MELPDSGQTAKGTLDWPHAPPHRLSEAAVCFVTARTRGQQYLLADDSMKDWFEAKLFELASEFGWLLEAWNALSKHYHFVGHSPRTESDAESLKPSVQKLHSLTTKEFNQREKKPGRTRLWQNYRETHLTFQRSYLARLNYVHQNAAHHGLVKVSSGWKWCSAKRFKESVTHAWLKTIASETRKLWSLRSSRNTGGRGKIGWPAS